MGEKKKHLGFFTGLEEQIRTNKVAFAVYCVLRLLVLLVIARCIWQGRWESVFVGVLALLLFLLPPFAEKTFHIQLPTTLEVLVLLFVFAAEILGEIECYYIRYPLWDTLLHTVNGFLCAAVGFCLVDLFNRNKRFRFELSPLFLSVVAFCFSMTIGVLWEFFEFGCDQLLHTDMQKDFLVSRISSFSLNPSTGNHVISMDQISTTVITSSTGESVTLNGYLDIGLLDTMKDLLVNFAGATVFSVIGYFYILHRGKGRLARQFIPVVLEKHEEEQEEQE